MVIFLMIATTKTKVATRMVPAWTNLWPSKTKLSGTVLGLAKKPVIDVRSNGREVNCRSIVPSLVVLRVMATMTRETMTVTVTAWMTPISDSKIKPNGTVHGLV